MTRQLKKIQTMSPTPTKFTLAILAATVFPVDAVIVPHIIERKTWTQANSNEFNFTGGNFVVEINDGFFITNPPPTPDDAIIFLGDFDGDGQDDGGATLSLASVTATTQLEPFRSDLVTLAVAPSRSRLERPMLGFNDFSFTVWWDFDVPFGVQQYDLAGYRLNRDYPATATGLRTMDREIIPGAYTFEVPALNNPVGRFRPVVQITAMPEAFPGRDGQVIKRGFRFTNEFNNNGAIEFDPRQFSQLTWEGIDQFTIRADDFVSISMLDAMGAPFVNGSGIPFPEFFLTTDRFGGEYTLVPFFFDPGDTATVRLRVQRGNDQAAPFPVGFIGIREFQAQLEFIDSFAGFSRFGVFPQDADPNLTEPEADFDGDGFNNFLEFVLNTDPNDATEFPGSGGPLTNPADSGANPGVLTVTSLADGRCQISVDKRPFTGSAALTNFEHSVDLVTWITIPSDGDVNGDGDNTDPGDWMVTDVVIDETVLNVDQNGDGDATDVFSRLTATSVSPITQPTVPGGPTSCFFRFVATPNQ